MIRRADAKDFVQRFQKIYPGRIPSSEVSLNYTAVHATAMAMKLAGTSTDAAAIRANLDKAFKQLPAGAQPEPHRPASTKRAAPSPTWTSP